MFEFYFQSGEFASGANGFWDFVKDLSIQVLGALVAAYAAVKLYYRQRNEQLANVAKEKRDRDIDNVVFFHHLVHNALECVRGQIPMYQKFAENIERSAFSLPAMEILRTTAALDRLVNKVDHGDFFHSYREINREIMFDQAPRSFQEGLARFDLMLGKIEHDTNTVTRTYNRCGEIAKRIRSVQKLIFRHSAFHHANFPANEITNKVESLKTQLNSIQSDDITIYQTSTRKFFADILEVIPQSPDWASSSHFRRISKHAADAIVAYNEIDSILIDMHGLALTNEKIFTEEWDRLKTLFGPLHEYATSQTNEGPTTK